MKCFERYIFEEKYTTLTFKTHTNAARLGQEEK